MLCERPFENLHRLTKIEIEMCDLTKFDFDSLNSIRSLETIDIKTFVTDINRKCSLKIDLNWLINLKVLNLYLHKENEFELITNSLNRLNTLKLRYKKMDFSNRFDFPELKCLDVFDVDLSHRINQQS